MLGAAAMLLAGGSLSYRAINGYPGDHGFEQLSAVVGYPPETWPCVIDSVEQNPIPGTVLGQFVVEPVYDDVNTMKGFKVDAAFGSQIFQIGDGNLIYYSAGEFRTYARLAECSATQPLEP